jgi:hypothetical protein
VTIPPNVRIDVGFDENGRVCLSGSLFRAVSNEKLTLDVTLKKLNLMTAPPSYDKVNVTGWTSRFVSKLHVDDVDLSKKWDVAGVIVAPATDGVIRFTVPKSSVNFIVQWGYAELIFTPVTDPEIRIPFNFTLTKPVVTI